MKAAKTSTFILHHARCNPETWTAKDILAFARFVKYGELPSAARLSKLGLQLVLSELYEPKGGTLKEVGIAKAGNIEDGSGIYETIAGLDDYEDMEWESITPVQRVYAGPVEYAFPVAVDDGDGGCSREYEIKPTEAEAQTYIDGMIAAAAEDEETP